MELPAALRIGVERILDGVPPADLHRASAVLSTRYRAEIRDGRLHLGDDLAARAYLATRLPATFAAIRTSLAAAAERLPDFAPTSLLDVGAGPGSALWAAADCWPDLKEATLIEASPSIRRVGEALGSELANVAVGWRAGRIEDGLADAEAADLVTLAYVLDELSPAAGEQLISRLWALTRGLLVVVEPGTPAGWRRILAARDQLIASGAAVVAPCAHASPCPLVAPDWCHFAARVARSRRHRLAKGGEVPWEDEKYIFIAASRHPVPVGAARVLAPPRTASGRVALKLCEPDGTARERLITRRDGDAFRRARRLDWGDALDEGT
ncbi:small ribosomal subunit Rsm22 family protein [Mangrovicella endophytica]|uniref:small ribosomal subunit Rsm22 family protein n=1 Tax=Mangrovicella endophytica TaxID=2066697 RepID=UPI000C9E49D2|nr:small ribosomal subunit Rsm22 family protein [Mangrovicella endophytica]